jgi:hypothetical protein
MYIIKGCNDSYTTKLAPTMGPKLQRHGHLVVLFISEEEILCEHFDKLAEKKKANAKSRYYSSLLIC